MNCRNDLSVCVFVCVRARACAFTNQAFSFFQGGLGATKARWNIKTAIHTHPLATLTICVIIGWPFHTFHVPQQVHNSFVAQIGNIFPQGCFSVLETVHFVSTQLWHSILILFPRFQSHCDSEC